MARQHAHQSINKRGRAAEANHRDVDAAVRQHVLALLDGGMAHATFDQGIADFPAELRGRKPEIDEELAPYTAWQLLEHMRIAQWDILAFSRNPKHISPEWPSGYWPHSSSPPDPRSWTKSVESFRSDLQAMKGLVSDPANDLYAPIPHGDGQTILREALLVADHNAYHLGQLVLLRKLLGAWKG